MKFSKLILSGIFAFWTATSFAGVTPDEIQMEGRIETGIRADLDPLLGSSPYLLSVLVEMESVPDAAVSAQPVQQSVSSNTELPLDSYMIEQCRAAAAMIGDATSEQTVNTDAPRRYLPGLPMSERNGLKNPAAPKDIGANQQAFNSMIKTAAAFNYMSNCMKMLRSSMIDQPANNLPIEKTFSAKVKKIDVAFTYDEGISLPIVEMARSIIIRKAGIVGSRGDRVTATPYKFPLAEKNSVKQDGVNPSNEIDDSNNYIVPVAIAALMLIIFIGALILLRKPKNGAGQVADTTPRAAPQLAFMDKSAQRSANEILQNLQLMKINRPEIFVSIAASNRELVEAVAPAILKFSFADKVTNLFGQQTRAQMEDYKQQSDRMSDEECLETLNNALSEISSISDSAKRSDGVNPFQFLDAMSPARIALIVAALEKNVRVLVVSQLSAEMAPKVLSAMKVADKVEVMIGMAAAKDVSGDDYAAAAMAAHEKSKSIPEVNRSSVGGVGFVSSLLDNMSETENTEILASIHQMAPHIYAEIRDKRITWTDIIRFPVEKLIPIIRAVDVKVISTALYEADQRIVDHVMSSVNPRTKKLIQEAIASGQEHGSDEVSRARKGLVDALRSAVDAKLVSKDDFINLGNQIGAN